MVTQVDDQSDIIDPRQEGYLSTQPQPICKTITFITDDASEVRAILDGVVEIHPSHIRVVDGLVTINVRLEGYAPLSTIIGESRSRSIKCTFVDTQV